MSTPNQPLNPVDPAYQVDVGGSLVIPPQPNVTTYPLRPDQFQTICDGEVSVSRSLRDACIGAFLTGMVGVAGVFLTVDWDQAVKQGRHPLPWTIGLCTVTGVAFIVGVVEWIRMWQTGSRSSYSRLIQAIKEYFHLPGETPSA
jgi:hypothetical protein